MTLDSSVIVCAHNEERYIEACLKSVLAQTSQPALIIVVLDRCTDKTEDLVRSTVPNGNLVTVRKTTRQWRNSIPENLEMGMAKVQGEALAVVDADMVLPSDFLERLLPQLKEYSSVSASAKTDPSRGLLNKVVSIWEHTYRLSPFGRQPRGGARVILSRDLNEIGGFRDVFSWDSDLDSRLRESGHKVRMDPTISVLHRRKMTLRRSISYQIQTGKARRELGISLGRTLMHSIFRLRPFVIYGYTKGGSSEWPEDT